MVGRYPAGGVEDLDRAVAAARKAFDDGPWPKIAGVERARVLNRVAEAIRANADDLAYVEALESGKPISQALDEIRSSADLWEYAATLCRHTYGDMEQHAAAGEAIQPSPIAICVWDKRQ